MGFGFIARSRSAPWKSRRWHGITDMSRREIAIFVPLIVATLWFGFYPAPVLDLSAASVGNLVQHYETRSIGAAATAAATACRPTR